MRRVFREDCYEDKTSLWRHSANYSVAQLRKAKPAVQATAKQTASNTVAIDIVNSNREQHSQVYRLCWKDEYKMEIEKSEVLYKCVYNVFINVSYVFEKIF